MSITKTDYSNYKASVASVVAHPDFPEKAQLLHDIHIDLMNALNIQQITYQQYRELEALLFGA